MDILETILHYSNSSNILFVKSTKALRLVVVDKFIAGNELSVVFQEPFRECAVHVQKECAYFGMHMLCNYRS